MKFEKTQRTQNKIEIRSMRICLRRIERFEKYSIFFEDLLLIIQKSD